MEIASDDQRCEGRFRSPNATATIHGLLAQPVVALVNDVSLGGLGITVPGLADVSNIVGAELSVYWNGVRCTAIVRHAGVNNTLGIEWKALALARALRCIPNFKNDVRLSGVLPGGLSFMWNLCEDGLYERLLDYSECLRQEAIAHGAFELVDPIQEFQANVRTAISGDEYARIVQTELDKLVSRCVAAVRSTARS